MLSMSSYEFAVKFYQQFAPVLAAGAFCGCFSASRDQEDEWSTYTFNRKNTGATLLRDADRIATGTRPVNEKIVERISAAIALWQFGELGSLTSSDSTLGTTCHESRICP